MGRRVQYIVKAGDVYDNYTVIKELPRKVMGKQKYRMVECRCVCNNIREVRLSVLKSFVVKGCGCMRGNPSPTIALKT